MEKRNIGEVITMFLVEGYLDEDDIIPVLKKGTAKMMGEKEEKIFTQPLQKESEWENQTCEVRWTEHGNFRVVCGAPYPCSTHTSKEEMDNRNRLPKRKRNSGGGGRNPDPASQRTF